MGKTGPTVFSIQLFAYGILSIQASFVGKIILPSLNVNLLKINSPLGYGFTFVLSILFYWSVCLFLCLYDPIYPTPVLLPGKSHGWRSLEGCSPWGRWGLDMTERLPFHFSHSCIGEGNGNPLQCSCLENPKDRGAWWAANYGVTQSRTRLKWLSSSSRRSYFDYHSYIIYFEIEKCESTNIILLFQDV